MEWSETSAREHYMKYTSELQKIEVLCQAFFYLSQVEVDNVLLFRCWEELSENSSDAENMKKLVVFESPLSDDDPSQKADLEKVANADLTLSFPEEKVQQMMLSESENIQDDREDDEECLESQNESDDRKINDGCSAAEVPCDNGESDHCLDLPTHELQKKSNQEEHKPIPKPRVHKPRNASASGEKKAFGCCHCYLLSHIAIF